MEVAESDEHISLYHSGIRGLSYIGAVLENFLQRKYFIIVLS